MEQFLQGVASEVKVYLNERRVKTVAEASELQGDLDRLYDWARKWQMVFNIRKCSVMSAGRNNLYIIIP